MCRCHHDDGRRASIFHTPPPFVLPPSVPALGQGNVAFRTLPRDRFPKSIRPCAFRMESRIAERIIFSWGHDPDLPWRRPLPCWPSMSEPLPFTLLCIPLVAIAVQRDPLSRGKDKIGTPVVIAIGASVVPSGYSTILYPGELERNARKKNLLQQKHAPGQISPLSDKACWRRQSKAREGN